MKKVSIFLFLLLTCSSMSIRCCEQALFHNLAILKQQAQADTKKGYTDKAEAQKSFYLSSKDPSYEIPEDSQAYLRSLFLLELNTNKVSAKLRQIVQQAEQKKS